MICHDLRTVSSTSCIGNPCLAYLRSQKNAHMVMDSGKTLRLLSEATGTIPRFRCRERQGGNENGNVEEELSIQLRNVPLTVPQNQSNNQVAGSLT